MLGGKWHVDLISHLYTNVAFAWSGTFLRFWLWDKKSAHGGGDWWRGVEPGMQNVWRQMARRSDLTFVYQHGFLRGLAHFYDFGFGIEFPHMWVGLPLCLSFLFFRLPPLCPPSFPALSRFVSLPSPFPSFPAGSLGEDPRGARQSCLPGQSSGEDPRGASQPCLAGQSLGEDPRGASQSCLPGQSLGEGQSPKDRATTKQAVTQRLAQSLGQDPRGASQSCLPLYKQCICVLFSKNDSFNVGGLIPHSKND